MEKNREKGWYQYYVTDWKWWTRFLHNVDLISYWWQCAHAICGQYSKRLTRQSSLSRCFANSYRRLSLSHWRARNQTLRLARFGDTRLAIARLLVSHDSAKGVACEIRLEPLPSLESLVAGSTPTAKRMCLLTLLDVRNTIYCACIFAIRTIELFHFYVLKWIKVRKLASLMEKGVYNLLEISFMFDRSLPASSTNIWQILLFALYIN